MTATATKAAAAKERARLKREAEAAGEDAEGVASDAGDAGTEDAKPRRAMPVYELEEVDAPPESAPDRPRGHGGITPRKSPYVELLTQMLEAGEGKWFQLARFSLAGAATTAARRLYTGQSPVPNGRWELNAVKLVNPEDPDGERTSALYARLHDADVDSVEFVNVTDRDKKWIAKYYQKQAEANADGDAGTDSASD